MSEPAQTLPLDEERRLDAVCQRWERVLRAGEDDPAVLHALLADCEGPLRDAALHECLLLAWHYRTPPQREPYEGRFADQAECVRRAWSDHQSDTGRDRTTLHRAPPRQPASHDPSSYGRGEAFGPYRLMGRLGAGGMGVVYRAEQDHPRRTVALKMIRAGRLASAEEVRRFRLEAEAAATLRHPGIVSVHEVGEYAGLRYFSMDLIAGRSLADVLADGRPAPEETARVVRDVARAVHHAHGLGVIHRDLKPANILIDEAGRVLVTDFGLAKRIGCDDEMTRTGAVLGTPHYMSPEQASGRAGAVTAASDVYSLGAVLYALLTGQRPFAEESCLGVMLKVLEAEPPLPRNLAAGVPAPLERICLRCMEKDPGDRYPDAAAVADDLHRWLSGEPLHTPLPSAWHRAQRWSLRHPCLVGHLASIGVGATTFGVRSLLTDTASGYFHRVALLFAVWLVLSCVCEWLLQLARTRDLARPLWSLVDVSLLTAILAVAEGDIGPLLIGYPALVVTAGLWFHVRLVTVTTAATVAGWACLLMLRPTPDWPPRYCVLFGGVLAVLGAVVAYQVHRFRTLSRYFEQG